MRNEPARRIDQPEVGWFRMRLIKRGPYVAARISRPFGCYWQATINGKSSPMSADPAEARVFDIWTWAEMISEGEYEALLKHAPADPYQPIHASKAGMADAISEQAERDYWATRPI